MTRLHTLTLHKNKITAVRDGHFDEYHHLRQLIINNKETPHVSGSERRAWSCHYITRSQRKRRLPSRSLSLCLSVCLSLSTLEHSMSTSAPAFTLGTASRKIHRGLIPTTFRVCLQAMCCGACLAVLTFCGGTLTVCLLVCTLKSWQQWATHGEKETSPLQCKAIRRKRKPKKQKDDDDEEEEDEYAASPLLSVSCLVM